MGTHGAVNLALRVIFGECFHDFIPHFIGRLTSGGGCTKIVKFFEFGRRLTDEQVGGTMLRCRL